MILLSELFRRKGGVTGLGGEAEDPLGLDVAAESKFPKDQLTVSSHMNNTLPHSCINYKRYRFVHKGYKFEKYLK